MPVAETGLMIDSSLGSSAEKLAALEAEEAQVSAERRRLQQLIDSGFATELSRSREREVSLLRRELHLQIDAVRIQLGLPTGPTRRAADESSLERTWSVLTCRSASRPLSPSRRPAVAPSSQG